MCLESLYLQLSLTPTKSQKCLAADEMNERFLHSPHHEPVNAVRVLLLVSVISVVLNGFS